MPATTAVVGPTPSLKDRFETTFDKIATPNRCSTLAEKARLIGVPRSSLLRMVSGERDFNAAAIRGLLRLGFTVGDLDYVIDGARPAPVLRAAA